MAYIIDNDFKEVLSRELTEARRDRIDLENKIAAVLKKDISDKEKVSEMWKVLGVPF